MLNDIAERTPRSNADDLIDAIEDQTETFWTLEKVQLVADQYKRALNKLLRDHPRDDDEGLAIRLSVFAASVGY